MKQGKYSARTSNGASIYLAAVLEYLTAEVLELAGTLTRESKRSRITPRTIMLGIKNDQELRVLLADVHISGAGVAPCIPQVLLYNAKERKAAITSGALTKNNWSKQVLNTSKPIMDAPKTYMDMDTEDEVQIPVTQVKSAPQL